jgi:hypothetical protein
MEGVTITLVFEARGMSAGLAEALERLEALEQADEA